MPVSAAGAIEYWGRRIGGETYIDETPERQEAALVSARDALAPYVTGLPAEDLEAATYEQALWLLGPHAEMQAAGVQSFSVTGLSETYAVGGRPLSIAPAAWRVICYGASGTGGRNRGAAWLL